MANGSPGRPTTYTDEIATQICDLLAEGKSMVKACAAVGISRRTVAKWLKDKPDFAEMTIQARGEWTDDIVDQIMDIAQDETRDYYTRRLMIDSIKWVAGKQRPKKYSEKFMVEHNGAVDHKHTIAEMTDAELEALIRAGSSRITRASEGEE
jgi:hypothetical protein